MSESDAGWHGTGWHGGRLSETQASWVRLRIRDAGVVHDMSWGPIASHVLHVRGCRGEFVVKAGDATNHHIGREIAAHQGWTDVLTASGHAARMLDADAVERVLLLEYLPGCLVEGTAEEGHPTTFAQAGALLRALHAQKTRVDAEYEPRANARAIRWLDGPHRVAAAAAATARSILEADPAPPVRTVPTHGDWQPRNWVVDRGTVRVIDFGRFAFRPAATDLVRLAAQQWRGRPDLEASFLDGYGEDPRDPERWRVDALREAIGTACWAFQVGDEAFEAQGHRMLADALREF